MSQTTPQMVAYLTDFQPLVAKPHIPQQVTLEYITRMMAISQCVQEKVTSQVEADRIYQDISEKMERFAVSSEYISQRQMHILPDSPEKALSEAAIPSADLFSNLAQEPFGDDLEKRMQYFDEVTSGIIARFYSGDSPQDNVSKPDDLIHVSCSGYLSPSPAQKVINAKGWRDVTVTHSYHMGCYGAFPPVRMAAGFLCHAQMLGDPKEQVDIIHTELLFTHLDISKTDPNNLVNMTLFADGFIKYSVKSAAADQIPAGKLKLLAMQDCLIKDSEEAMTWVPSHHHFNMFLSREVPVLIRDTAFNFLETLCAKAGIDFLTEKDKLVFAIHPGGPKILDHLAEVLELQDWQLQTSRQVLYENGNMSSATIPHIWKQISEDADIASGTQIVTMAFGPGLTATGFILEKS